VPSGENLGWWSPSDPGGEVSILPHTHAHLPRGWGVSRRYRSSSSESAEGLSHGSRRRAVAWEPNRHNLMLLAHGVEP